MKPIAIDVSYYTDRNVACRAHGIVRERVVVEVRLDVSERCLPPLVRLRWTCWAASQSTRLVP